MRDKKAPPSDLQRQVIKTIVEQSMIKKGEHIVIGLSGGPDSLCLFFLLTCLSIDLDLKLYPVHVNHKFRPNDAESDEAFVVDFCEKKGYTCRVFTYDCNEMASQRKITSEEAGRIARYESFATVANELFKNGIDRKKISIAVGQNSDDQSETILFRILRGVGTDGLKSIEYIRYDEDGNKVIRPLLDVSRRQIEEYCAFNSLTPCIDKTNYEPIYTRNKIRLELLPLLQREYNSNIKSALLRLAKTASVDSNYLQEQARVAFDVVAKIEPSCVTIDCDSLKMYHKSIINRVIIKAFNVLGLNYDISYHNLEDCYNIIFSDAGTKSINLPHGFVLKRIYSKIEICNKERLYSQNCNEHSLSGFSNESTPFGIFANNTPLLYGCNNGSIEIKTQIITKDKYNEISSCLKPSLTPNTNRNLITDGTQNSYTIAFDSDKISDEYNDGLDCLKVRNRIQGDYIFISSDKRKKIQDLFVDKKIPKDLRDEIVLLAIRSNVLTVFFPDGAKRISSKYSIDEVTKNVLFVEFAMKM